MLNNTRIQVLNSPQKGIVNITNGNGLMEIRVDDLHRLEDAGRVEVVAPADKVLTGLMRVVTSVGAVEAWVAVQDTDPKNIKILLTEDIKRGLYNYDLYFTNLKLTKDYKLKRRDTSQPTSTLVLGIKPSKFKGVDKNGKMALIWAEMQRQEVALGGLEPKVDQTTDKQAQFNLDTPQGQAGQVGQAADKRTIVMDMEYVMTLAGCIEACFESDDYFDDYGYNSDIALSFEMDPGKIKANQFKRGKKQEIKGIRTTVVEHLALHRGHGKRIRRLVAYVDADRLELCRDATMLFSGISLHSIDLSNIDFSKVEILREMFCNTKIRAINLKGMNAERAKTAEGMFSGSENLRHIEMRGANLSRVEDIHKMFKGVGLRVREGTIISLRRARLDSVKCISNFCIHSNIKRIDIANIELDKRLKEGIIGLLDNTTVIQQ